MHQFACGFVPQKELTRRLGVHTSTVSKMLTRLEELGLIRRERSKADARQRNVFLTDAGRSTISRAIADALHEGHAVLSVNFAIAPLRLGAPREALQKIRRTNGTLRRYALSFHDTADPLYAPAVA